MICSRFLILPFRPFLSIFIFLLKIKPNLVFNSLLFTDSLQPDGYFTLVVVPDELALRHQRGLAVEPQDEGAEEREQHGQDAVAHGQFEAEVLGDLALDDVAQEEAEEVGQDHVDAVADGLHLRVQLLEVHGHGDRQVGAAEEQRAGHPDAKSLESLREGLECAEHRGDQHQPEHESARVPVADPACLIDQLAPADHAQHEHANRVHELYRVREGLRGVPDLSHLVGHALLDDGHDPVEAAHADRVERELLDAEQAQDHALVEVVAALAVQAVAHQLALGRAVQVVLGQVELGRDLEEADREQQPRAGLNQEGDLLVVLEDHGGQPLAEQDAQGHGHPQHRHLEGLDLVAEEHAHEDLRLDCGETLVDADDEAAENHYLEAHRAVNLDLRQRRHREEEEAHCEQHRGEREHLARLHLGEDVGHAEGADYDAQVVHRVDLARVGCAEPDALRTGLGVIVVDQLLLDGRDGALVQFVEALGQNGLLANPADGAFGLGRLVVHKGLL
mmetsp:Transcript_65679/g.141930  ORF Transcript_65679/g.141930 Transcript_65679/m.141930 type:complete len:504 (+) Transcript_65679:154-1665(+)